MIGMQSRQRHCGPSKGSGERERGEDFPLHLSNKHITRDMRTLLSRIR